MHTLTENVGFCAQLLSHECKNCFFPQDGATCCTSRDSMACVQEPGFKWNMLYLTNLSVVLACKWVGNLLMPILCFHFSLPENYLINAVFQNLSLFLS
jgi:hypothetical protein